MPAPWRLFFVILAIVLFLLLALIGGQVFTDTAAKPETIWLLLGLGSASFAAAHI